MNKNLPREIIVLGMHRSGTSMLSGLLDILGVDMGDDYPGRQLSNPLGHFEDGDLLRLNESILVEAGGSWDHPPPLTVIKKQAPIFEEKIKQIIQYKQANNKGKLWGWKDPRTSLTIDLYFPYLRNPAVIWCQRDQADISNSLWKRNKISPQASEDLTNHYQEQIRDFFYRHPEIPVLKIFYQDIVKEPLRWILEVVDFLEIDVDQDQIAQAESFILPKELIQRKKNMLWWRNILSLPIRFYNKIGLKK